MTDTRACAYCDLDNPTQAEPIGGWIYRDQHWLVGHGQPDTTMAGALRITSTRHYIDFAAMTPGESASFGPLYSRLDAALRAVTGAERVHLVSTRDRIQHFHAGSIHAPRNTHYAAPNSSMPLNAAIPRRLNAPPTR